MKTTEELEWKLVPVEPTGVMLIAANAAWPIPDPSPFDKGDEARRTIYAAMLAAAPAAPGVVEVDDAMVERALGAWFPWRNGTFYSAEVSHMRAALTAALAGKDTD